MVSHRERNSHTNYPMFEGYGQAESIPPPGLYGQVQRVLKPVPPVTRRRFSPTSLIDHVR